MLDFLEILKLFVIPVALAFSSAYFGAWFAIKKYKEEKLWDERQKSYKAVINAFEELIHWAEQERAIYFCEPYNSVESKYEESLREISRYAEAGELTFPKEFHQAIVDTNNALFRFRFEVNEDSLGDMETERDCVELALISANGIARIIREYLPKLIQIAKEDSH